MTKREWVTKAFNGEKVDKVPVGFWFHFLDNEVISDGMKDPSLIEQNLEGHRKFRDEFDPDFVKLMSDGLFYRPDYTYPELKTSSDLAKVKALPRDHEWLNACVEHAKKVREIFGGDILIFYNVPSPFHHILKQLTGTSGMKEYPKCLAEDPESFMKANDALLSDMLNLTERVLTEGLMDGIYFGLHNDNVFTDEQYNKYIAPSEIKILELANSIKPINIAHVCGYRGRINNFDVYKDYPAKVFNWSLHTTDLTIAEGKKFFTNCTCVIGGYDQSPGSLIHAGSKKDIQNFCIELIKENGQEGFVIGADCTIPSDTPIENLTWVKEARDAFSEREGWKRI